MLSAYRDIDGILALAGGVKSDLLQQHGIAIWLTGLSGSGKPQLPGCWNSN